MDERLTLRTPRPPNVLWIFGDQHRAHATSYRGDRNVFTPNIDNLAREGMRFDCAVAGAPWCTPFRGALLSGRYPNQTGVIRTPSALAPEIPTVAHAFGAAGYHTAHVGKWHLDGSNDREHYVPPERRGGFHYWMGYENNNNQHECYVHGSAGGTPQRLPGYETDALSDLLIEHLRSHVGVGPNGSSGRGGLTPADSGPDYQPFFAVLSVQPPHGPNVPPTNPSYGAPRIHPAAIRLHPNVPASPAAQERARFRLAGYYPMIENLDYNIGRIRQALTQMGVDRDTYVVFFSDHGDMMGQPRPVREIDAVGGVDPGAVHRPSRRRRLQHARGRHRRRDQPRRHRADQPRIVQHRHPGGHGRARLFRPLHPAGRPGVSRRAAARGRAAERVPTADSAQAAPPHHQPAVARGGDP